MIIPQIAPDVMKLGLEYAVLCPGPADTDLVRKMDHTRIRHSDLIRPEAMANFVSPYVLIKLSV